MSFASFFWQIIPSENTALIDASTHQHYTYAELRLAVEQQQKLLPITPTKQLVVVIAHTSIQTIINYLAVLNAGHSAWLLDPQLSNEQRESLFVRYAPHCLLDDQQVTHFVSNTVLHSDLALLLSTSGSTGSPKLVRLSWKNLSVNCQQIVQFLPLTHRSQTITSLPLHYSFGLSVLHSHLFVQAPIVVSHYSLLQREFWSTINQYPIRCFYGVPYHYQLITKLGYERFDLASFNFFAQAGGALALSEKQQLRRLYEQYGLVSYLMYGQTEATARIAYFHINDIDVLDSPVIGQAIPGGRLEIAGNSELIYYGANIMLGYAQKVEDLALGATLSQLATGDYAQKNAQGQLFLQGRARRFIKLHGQRVNLDEVQQWLQHRFDTDIACLGEEDCLRVFVVKAQPSLQQALCRWLKIHPSLCCIQKISAIPYSSHHKINYSKLATL